MMTLREVCSDATQTVILRDPARIGQVHNIRIAGATFVRNAFTMVTHAISGGEREHLVHRWRVSCRQPLGNVEGERHALV